MRFSFFNLSVDVIISDLVFVFPSHSGDIWSVAFSPVDSMLIVASTGSIGGTMFIDIRQNSLRYFLLTRLIIIASD